MSWVQIQGLVGKLYIEPKLTSSYLCVSASGSEWETDTGYLILGAWLDSIHLQLSILLINSSQSDSCLSLSAPFLEACRALENVSLRLWRINTSYFMQCPLWKVSMSLNEAYVHISRQICCIFKGKEEARISSRCWSMKDETYLFSK